MKAEAPHPRHGRAHNPFSTSNWGPDVTDYIFRREEDHDTLLAKVDAGGWRAELVGPHGAGKSTLLATLRREAERQGLSAAFFQCNAEQSRLPEGWRSEVVQADVCFVDGAELLNRFRLRRLRRYCQRHGTGLMVTMHRSIEIGFAWPVECSARELSRVIEQLLPGATRLLPVSEIRRRLDDASGNARSVLFSLYDDFENGFFDTIPADRSAASSEP